MENVKVEESKIEEKKTATEIKIKIEFSGGLELLFDKIKKQSVSLFTKSKGDTSMVLKDVLFYMRDNLLKERPELFLQQDTVRPGILVLINDTDWELEGGIDAEIKDGDTLTFISTLHGG